MKETALVGHFFDKATENLHSSDSNINFIEILDTQIRRQQEQQQSQQQDQQQQLVDAHLQDLQPIIVDQQVADLDQQAQDQQHAQHIQTQDQQDAQALHLQLPEGQEFVDPQQLLNQQAQDDKDTSRIVPLKLFYKSYEKQKESEENKRKMKDDSPTSASGSNNNNEQTVGEQDWILHTYEYDQYKPWFTVSSVQLEGKVLSDLKEGEKFPSCLIKNELFSLMVKLKQTPHLIDTVNKFNIDNWSVVIRAHLVYSPLNEDKDVLDDEGYEALICDGPSSDQDKATTRRPPRVEFPLTNLVQSKELTVNLSRCKVMTTNKGHMKRVFLLKIEIGVTDNQSITKPIKLFELKAPSPSIVYSKRSEIKQFSRNIANAAATPNGNGTPTATTPGGAAGASTPTQRKRKRGGVGTPTTPTTPTTPMTPLSAMSVTGQPHQQQPQQQQQHQQHQQPQQQQMTTVPINTTLNGMMPPTTVPPSSAAYVQSVLKDDRHVPSITVPPYTSFPAALVLPSNMQGQTQQQQQPQQQQHPHPHPHQQQQSQQQQQQNQQVATTNGNINSILPAVTTPTTTINNMTMSPTTASMVGLVVPTTPTSGLTSMSPLGQAGQNQPMFITPTTPTNASGATNAPVGTAAPATNAAEPTAATNDAENDASMTEQLNIQ